jgi:pimeloyl-ACP methyl ester carboxylesterase
MARMDRAAIDGIELEFEIRGAGEPVVLIHAGHFADRFRPLLDEPALVGRYRVATYHRVGCGGSSRIEGAVSFAQQAAHCRSLMRYLGRTRDASPSRPSPSSAKSRELDPIWEERQALLLAWLPNVEAFVLAGASHLLQVENPRGMAQGLSAFFARHPLG